MTNGNIFHFWFFIQFLAIKDGLARIHTFRIKRKSHSKPLVDILKEKCDVTRPSDPKDKV